MEYSRGCKLGDVSQEEMSVGRYAIKFASSRAALGQRRVHTSLHEPAVTLKQCRPPVWNPSLPPMQTQDFCCSSGLNKPTCPAPVCACVALAACYRWVRSCIPQQQYSSDPINSENHAYPSTEPELHIEKKTTQQWLRRVRTELRVLQHHQNNITRTNHASTSATVYFWLVSQPSYCRCEGLSLILDHWY